MTCYVFLRIECIDVDYMVVLSYPTITFFGIPNANSPNSLRITHMQTSIDTGTRINFIYTITDDLNNSQTIENINLTFSTNVVYEWTFSALNPMRRYKISVQSYTANASTTSYFNEYIYPYSDPVVPIPILTPKKEGINVKISIPPENQIYFIYFIVYIKNSNTLIFSPIITRDKIINGIADITYAMPMGDSYSISAATYISFVNNSTGEATISSDFSPYTDSVYPYTNPEKPTIISLVPEYKSIVCEVNTESWTNQNWGFASPLGYNIWIDDHFYLTILATELESISTIIIPNLEPKLNYGVYKVQIETVNLYLASALKSSASTQYTYKEPNAIASPTIVSLANKYKIYFSPPQNNNSPILYYNYVVYGTNNEIVVPWEPLSYLYEIDGLARLTINNSYKIGIKAINAGGESIESTTSYLLLDDVPFIPNAPICSFNYGNYFETKYGYIDISFVVPMTNSSLVSEYSLYIIETLGDGTLEYYELSFSTGSAVSKDTILSYRFLIDAEGDKYKFRVKVKNAVGYGDYSEYSNEIYATPRPQSLLLYAKYYRTTAGSTISIRYTNYLYDPFGTPANISIIASIAGNIFIGVADLTYIGNNQYDGTIYVSNYNAISINLTIRLQITSSRITYSTPQIYFSNTPEAPILSVAYYNQYSQNVFLTFSISNTLSYTTDFSYIQYSIDNTQFTNLYGVSLISSAQTLSFLMPSITSGTILYVRSINSIDKSPTTSSILIAFPPNKMTSANFNITPSNLSLFINVISEPETMLNYPVISYKYSIYDANNAIVYSDTYNKTTGISLPFSIKVSNLTVNTQYYAKIVATNSIGDSLISEKSNIITVYGIPNSPTDVLVYPKYKSVDVSFNLGFNNSSSILSNTIYIYQVNVDSEPSIYKIVTTELTELNIVDLVENNTYYISVYSTNLAGNSGSIQSSNFIPYKEPNPPIIYDIIPKYESFDISWTTPNNNSSHLVGYKMKIIYVSATGSEKTIINQYSVEPYNIYHVSDLSANITYTVSISAINSGGQSAYSSAYTVLPYKEPNAPIAPLITKGYLSATVFPNSVAPLNNGAAITSYHFILYKNGEIDQTMAITYGTESATFNNLIADMSYNAAIYATNMGGNSLLSPVSNLVNPYGYPLLPVNLIATPGNKEIKIKFNSPPINEFNKITKYKYKLIYNATTISNEILIVPNLNEYTYTISFLVATTEYSIELTSFNGIWAPYSGEMVVATVYSEPGKPIISKITPGFKCAFIKIKFPNNNSAEITGVTFTNKKNGTKYRFAINTNPVAGTEIEYQINNLAYGKEYIFLASVSNIAGDSVQSIESDIVVPYTIPSINVNNTVITPSNELLILELDIDDGYTPLLTYTYKKISDPPSPFDRSTTNLISSNNVINLGANKYEFLIKNYLYGYTEYTEYPFINGTSYKIEFYLTNLAGKSTEKTYTFIPYGIPDTPTVNYTFYSDTRELTIYSIICPFINGNPIVNFKYSLYLNSTYMILPEFTNSYTIKLQKGTQYDITFVSTNAAGNSSPTEPISFYTPPDVPDSPVIISADTFSNYINVYFNAALPNGLPIVSYTYNISSSNTELIQAVFTPVATSTFGIYMVSIPNTMPLVLYSIYLQASNELGISLPSEVYTVKTSNIPDIPTIVDIVSYTNKLKIICDLPKNNGANIDFFKIYTNNLEVDISLSHAVVNGSNIVFIINPPSMSYVLCSISISAHNKNGFSLSSEKTIAYHYPYAPEFTIYYDISPTTATVRLDASSALLPFTHYKYQYLLPNDLSTNLIQNSVYNTESLIINKTEPKTFSILFDLSNSQQYKLNSWLIKIQLFNALSANTIYSEILCPIITHLVEPIFINSEYTNVPIVYNGTITTVDYCEQKRLNARYNIPLPRFEINSPYTPGGFTKEQLDMRRKTEILKYLSNRETSQTNNMTKNEKFAYSMTKYTVNKGAVLSYLVDSCMNPACRPPKPSSSSNVPGSLVLYEDSSVPLYNFKIASSLANAVSTNNSKIVPDYVFYSGNLYSSSFTYETKSTDWVFYHNDFLTQTNEQNIGTIILNDGIKTPQLTYTINIPIGLSLRGNVLRDLSNQLYKIQILEVDTGIYFNNNKLINKIDYLPNTLSDVSFYPTFNAINSNAEFKLSIFLGTYSTQFTVHTASNYIYNITIQLIAKITTLDEHGNTVDTKLNIPLNYIFNMNSERNTIQNLQLV